MYYYYLVKYDAARAAAASAPPVSLFGFDDFYSRQFHIRIYSTIKKNNNDKQTRFVFFFLSDRIDAHTRKHDNNEVLL